MDYILLDINTQIYDDGKRGFMFAFSSYFNRQSLTLIGLIVILLSIPLTAMLAQKTQQLRQRAAPIGEVIFTDANGNPLGQTTTNQDVYLKIVPPDGWTLAQGPSLLPKAYAQLCTQWDSQNCTIPGGTACSDWGSPDYCDWDVSKHFACQQRCTPTPTPTPAPPQPTPTPTSAPAGPISAGGCSNPAGNLGDYNSICTNQSAGCPSNAGEAKVYQCDGTNWQFKYPQCETKCAVSTPPTQPPAPTTAPPFVPVVLRQIYIQNKDGGSGGHTPARITAGAGLEDFKKGNFFLVPWKLTDGIGQKTVQVDFYEQPDNDSAGRKTATASITLTTPGADARAAGTDVADCSDDTITIDGTNYKKHPGIVVNNKYSVAIIMNNTKVSNVQTNTWQSNYSLRYLGGDDAASALGLSSTKIDLNTTVAPGGQGEFKITMQPRRAGDFNFKWQMYNDKGASFGGFCKPEFTVFTTLPGASPSPGAPGTCPTDRQYACAFITSQLPACAGSSAGTGVGWELISQLSCSLVSPGANCYFCKQIDAPTPTPTTPTPTPFFQGCKQCFDQFCDSFRLRDDKCPQDRPVCFRDGSCVAGLPTSTTTPTPTPPPGAPTTTPIPPGSTLLPIRVTLQEYLLASPGRSEKKPTASRLSRPDASLRLILTSPPPTGFSAGQSFESKTTLIWRDQPTPDGNLGFYEATAAFAPSLLPSGANTYDVLVKDKNHLMKKIATGVSITQGQQNQLVNGTSIPLIVGDVSPNNRINLTDINTLARCLEENVKRGLTTCSDEEKKNSDLDDDGQVTIFDYNWIVENFTKPPGDEQ